MNVRKNWHGFYQKKACSYQKFSKNATIFQKRRAYRNSWAPQEAPPWVALDLFLHVSIVVYEEDLVS